MYTTAICISRNCKHAVYRREMEDVFYLKPKHIYISFTTVVYIDTMFGVAYKIYLRKQSRKPFATRYLITYLFFVVAR